MKITVLLLIFLVLVILDKGLTILNIKQVEKNNPGIDYLSIEKNPAAKWFMRKLGVYWGTIIYGLISFITVLLAYILLRRLAGDNWAIYIIFFVYGLVITNNLFWLLKFSGVLK